MDYKDLPTPYKRLAFIRICQGNDCGEWDYNTDYNWDDVFNVFEYSPEGREWWVYVFTAIDQRDLPTLTLTSLDNISDLLDCVGSNGEHLEFYPNPCEYFKYNGLTSERDVCIFCGQEKQISS